MVDMNHDYWKDYYRLRRIIESGKGTPDDYNGLRIALVNAEIKSDMVKHNWHTLGVAS